MGDEKKSAESPIQDVASKSPKSDPIKNIDLSQPGEVAGSNLKNATAVSQPERRRISSLVNLKKVLGKGDAENSNTSGIKSSSSQDLVSTDEMALKRRRESNVGGLMTSKSSVSLSSGLEDKRMTITSTGGRDGTKSSANSIASSSEFSSSAVLKRSGSYSSVKNGEEIKSSALKEVYPARNDNQDTHSETMSDKEVKNSPLPNNEEQGVRRRSSWWPFNTADAQAPASNELKHTVDPENVTESQTNTAEQAPSQALYYETGGENNAENRFETDLIANPTVAERSRSSRGSWLSWIGMTAEKESSEFHDNVEGDSGTSERPISESENLSDQPKVQHNNVDPAPDNVSVNQDDQTKKRWFWSRDSMDTSTASSRSKDNDIGPTDIQHGDQLNSNDDSTSTSNSTSNSNSNSQSDERVPPKSTHQNPSTGNSNGTGKSWAFWSRFSSSETNNNDGELAISGTGSEDEPSKTSGPPSLSLQETQEQQLQSKESDSLEDKSRKSVKYKGKDKDERNKSPNKKAFKKPNMVIPAQEKCLPPYSSTQAIKSTIKQKLLTILSSEEEKKLYVDSGKHLFRTAPCTRIRKAVVIGVHGFFPIKLVRSLIGEPTGTSIRFANNAALALQRWAERHNVDLEIEKIALEGEGKVFERVETLYGLLKNWIEHIKEADFIFVAAHSQGTPVAVHLIAKLIEEGYGDGKKIGMIGMAGISLGPFMGLDQKLVLKALSTIENESMMELFQFQKEDSIQSRKYLDSLRTVVAQNVKLTFVGSTNDQLVPLYSSTCLHVSHPCIYRAAFVDGSSFSPDFVTSLIDLCLMLRNMGRSDHGVISELSGALAGTLTGGGHSKIYNELDVYDLGIRNALETTDVSSKTPLIHLPFVVRDVNANPFHLPWSMRGLLYEAGLNSRVKESLKKVLAEFRAWNPESKQLKDIKYRLSAVDDLVIQSKF